MRRQHSNNRQQRPLRVLVVEDQMIVALQLESMLRDAGCDVVGPVGSVHAAMSRAKDEPLDAAILDINLDGEKVFLVAETLQQRGIPIAFATGYAEEAIPQQWRAIPRLTKPFQTWQLRKVVSQLTRG